MQLKKNIAKESFFSISQEGCRAITGQEKRLMVQNYAHFQQCCYPGAMGNYFADGAEVPRCEAACAICARKDFLEYRHKLRLFAELPAETAIGSTEDLESKAPKPRRHNSHL